MTSLERMKGAQSLGDVAKLLRFTPSGLSYILYKLEPQNKYRVFTVPKKSGGNRIIHAPEAQLALLQKRLAELLDKCVLERKQKNARFWFASHGFHQGRTIVSNAAAHRRRRFVFNLDLEDFFGTINFGRVRGFFIRDSMFALSPKVATIIAQIVCHDNALPQGSPCSPIVSNLIGNILDSRLLGLAQATHCTYTRYADDLTFSTNERLFPTEIAVNTHAAEWEVGNQLKRTIERSGFFINLEKTRMSLRQSRQTVTGLVVNEKVNINQHYYRNARAMCNSVFRTGSFFKPTKKSNSTTPIHNLNIIDGTLSHIFFVKSRRDRKSQMNRDARSMSPLGASQALERLYNHFLAFKYFANPQAPLIVTEGISDIIYLKSAINASAKKFSLLAREENGKTIRLINFLKPSFTLRHILNLGQGAAGQASLISQYEKIIARYDYKTMSHPVIILCDNDDGLKSLVKPASKLGVTISTTTVEPFYHLSHNLYLVKVPEGSPAVAADIESLFENTVLATVLDGKTFNRKKEHADHTQYGKTIFAESVVRANAGQIDFSGFDALLSRVEDVLRHYVPPTATLPLAASAASGAAPSGGTTTP